jgi:hypothetical protein
VNARAKLALALCAAALTASVAAIPAAAEPSLDLQLNRLAVPVTHSDERLGYEIRVKNVASKNVAAGDTLTCANAQVGGNPAPTVMMEWLRNGVPIPGSKGPLASAKTYTTVAADEGKSLQCAITTSSDPDGPGGSFAPIGHFDVSPPVVVEPVPSPAPPTGVSSPNILPPNSVSTPAGTATTTAGSKLLTNVVTTKGAGTLAAGSKTITGVTTTSGGFSTGFPYQAISGVGIPGPARGTAVLNVNDDQNGSDVLTGVTTSSGAFTVGQEIRGASGIGQGVMIEAVGSETLELSNPVGIHLAGTVVDIHSYTRVMDVNAGAETLEVSAPATLSGSQSLSAGAFPFAFGQKIIGAGIPLGAEIARIEGQQVELTVPATATGSAVAVTGKSEMLCSEPVGWSGFASARTTFGSNVLTDVITAEGSGALASGSKTITGVSTKNGTFAVGQTVNGNGILSGAKIISVGAGTIELSLPVTSSGNQSLSAGPQPFAVGEPIRGTGIPTGTTITAIEGQKLTLSANVTLPRTIESKYTIAVWNAATGGGDWSFQWLRNGDPIPGETNATYVVQGADTSPPSILQCKATVKDAAGNEAVSLSGVIATTPAPPPPYVSPFGGSGEITFNNKTDGKVTVEAEFPLGTKVMRASDSGSAAVNLAWQCVKSAPAPGQPSTVKCSREDSLPPGASYPPLEVIAQVSPDAPDTLTTKASVSGGGAPVPATDEDTVSGILPALPFGFQAFETAVLDEAGADFTQAGGHPQSAGASLEFTEHVRAERSSESGDRAVNGAVRVIKTDTPPGFVGNPQAITEKCPSAADVVELPSTCPAGSAIGGIDLETEQGTFANQPLYVIDAERGTPAQLGFGVAVLRPGFGYTLSAELRPQENYAIRVVTAPIQKFPELFGAKVTLCDLGAKTGVTPSSQGETKFLGCKKAGDGSANELPFLSLPTRCGDPKSTITDIYADTWQEPGKYTHAQFAAPDLTGCNALSFEPTLKARPTTNAADSPTGLEVDLNIPQNQDIEGTATAHLKKATITLPEGLVVNPSSANGLDACSEAQLGMASGVPNGDPAQCPNASKIGSVQVETPVLDHALPGDLYLASPHANPFGSLLALYLTIEDPESGIIVKLPGQVETDPKTGRITTTFDQNPQLPVEDVQVKLRSGATAPLRTPATCGRYSTTSSLTPWSAPESGPPATPKDNYQINKGANGGSCASRATSLPNSPAFEAGTASPIASRYSPFVVKLRREDGSQQFSSIAVTPPPGLLAKLTGVPYCPESAVAAAEAKTGKEEQASPSCPAASQVGTVVAGAGAGPAPYYASGKAYLTGPYKGAPLSLAIVTPAVAGPFDLGNVVVKTALQVNPETAKVTAVSDPLPTILQGIPLDVRSVAVSLDRPDFTLNPTSCDPMEVTGSLTSTLGQAAPLANRFQVGECTRLGFKPNLRIKLKGSTKRTGNPALTATVTYPSGGYANIASASVALPHSEFLDQGHIKTICTRVQFAADQCPAGAIYGKAKATTPLLDQPLEGPVYLRSSSNPLPDLVVDLRGQIHVALVGRIDSVNGGIRTTFDSVPDAPVSKFTLEMQGGAKGLLENSRDLCKTVNKATATFTGQNGKAKELRPALQAQCGKKPSKKSKRRR